MMEPLKSFKLTVIKNTHPSICLLQGGWNNSQLAKLNLMGNVSLEQHSAEMLFCKKICKTSSVGLRVFQNIINHIEYGT